LFRSGICPAVKTCDPNIDSDLFRTLLQNKKIPAGIIKSCEAMKDAPVAEKATAASYAFPPLQSFCEPSAFAIPSVT
jgi:hypothetical protein